MMFPFGVYDAKRCCMLHIGLYQDEDECWQVFLGWPSDEEIAHAKASGLRVLPLTVNYDPPRQGDRANVSAGDPVA